MSIIGDLSEIAKAYIVAFEESLPPGPLWDIDKDESLALLILAVTNEMSLVGNRVQQVFPFGEGAPLYPLEALDEWEDVFGLPDDCSPPSFDDAARAAAIRAAFLAQGGQTASYYLDLLWQVFGLQGTIDENYYAAFTVSDGSGTDIPPWSGSVVGDPLYSYADWFQWRINIPGSQFPSQDVADRIECLFNRIRPAHTTVIINYSYTVENVPGYGPIAFGPTGEGAIG